MADRYWVGGSGNWNTSSTTNWSTTSGGAGGASVPTAADSVFFDQAGTYTVTMTGALNCLDFTVSAGTVTFAQGTSPSLSIAGSLLFSLGTVWNMTGSITFSSVSTGRTITTNGVVMTNNLTFNGGGGWTLGSALTMSGFRTLSIDFGSFNTGNYNISGAGQIVSNSGSTRSVTLGTSTITHAGNWNFSSSGMTFSGASSTIVNTAASFSFTSGGLVYGNVTFTQLGVGNTIAITGASTYNNFSITTVGNPGVAQVTFDTPQTINGTLSVTSSSGTTRTWLRGVSYPFAQTLTLNSAPSLTNVDFRDIYVVGTAAPISGTRIGNLRGCRGINFSEPKTVYRVSGASSNWSASQWSDSSGGAVSADNFPLAQDVAVIDNNSGSSVSFDSAFGYVGTVDMSARTTSVTITLASATTVYGDWINGSLVTFAGTSGLTFSGRTTQTITSSGRAFPCSFTIDTFGGTVFLADAINLGNQSLTVTNGTFDTSNYNVTASLLSSNNSNIRTINLGSSTVTLSSSGAIVFTNSTNLSFNAGTSSINISGSYGGTNQLELGSQTYNNFTYTNTSTSIGLVAVIGGQNTFNNFTHTAPSTTGVQSLAFALGQTVTGTLTVSGASPTRRVFVRSSIFGSPVTLNVNSLSAADSYFRDISITGTAAGTTPTRAGDCGGNTGISFPAPKTVYWSLAGVQGWSSTGWASTSGGTPNVNNFPLPQDTAVFDNAGSAGTVIIEAAWHVGAVNMSARTSAMTLQADWSFNVYGSWTFGAGVTVSSGTSAVTFSGRGTQTITSNGVAFNFPVSVDSLTGKVQLADALVVSGAINLFSGEFDAASYNVTATAFSTSGSSSRTFRMGSGTWTLSGIGTVWIIGTTTNFVLYKGTANIVLSDTSASARTFAGGDQSYNKLTIGGATGTSILTITGANQFTELASTKTVAHTIDFGSTTQTFGKWSVTGSAGNVVTLAGTGTTHVLAGVATSGIDYLSMGSIGFSSTSPGEFYAGANSTGTAGAPVYRTAPPTPRTLYWVGGTGNWSNTAKWSTTSGGAGGAAVPTSLDTVNFNSASNATAYTVTIDVNARCNAFQMYAPASGAVTLAGSTALIVHGNTWIDSTNVSVSYTGPITLAGSSGGNQFTSSNFTLSSVTVNGVGSGWVLGSAATLTSSMIVINGSFTTNGLQLTCSGIFSPYYHARSISLVSNTHTLSGSAPINFGTTESERANLTFSAGTSQINLTSASLQTFSGNNQTFNNVSFASTGGSSGLTFNGANTFNNLSISASSGAGIRNFVFADNQTINGTFTCSAPADASRRNFIQSNTLGATRTLTCAAASLTDVDFRDITIAGAAAPVSGTRLGDCKGNSGITFPAPKTVYWNLAIGGNWSATAWATTSGGTPAANNFPLAQDTAIIENTGLNAGAAISAATIFNTGTVDMSARTLAVTLNITSDQYIYGNWINGSGSTVTGTVLWFYGRSAQTLTSAGKTLGVGFVVESPGGSLTLQDSLICNAIFVTAGTFNAANYNVTSSAALNSIGSSARAINFGSGTWTLSTNGSAVNIAGSKPTVTGTGTIRLTSANSKTFAGNSLSFAGMTLDNGGAGTLTITGDNTFADITNSYKSTGAATIVLGSGSTQRVGRWSASGEAGRILTVTSVGANLIFTGYGQATSNTDYLSITNVRAYSLSDIWYAGANSVNNGSLGWVFAAGVAAAASGLFFLLF